MRKIIGNPTEFKSNRSGSFPAARQLREFIGNRTPKSRHRTLCRMPGKCQQNKACALGSCGRAAAHASRVASLNTALYAVAGQAAQPSAGSHPPQPHMPPAHGGLPSSSTFRACGDAQVTRTDISCLRLMDTSPESEFHRTETPVAEGNPQINTILCRLWLWSSRLGAGLPASS